ncbi:putative secreted protein, signal peptide [Cryptosporidium felis]|nr:putative secreted protein, signal peptide [Cryptosporidium felis]
MTLIFLLILLNLKIKCLVFSESINEIEFPPSWHFFENHNSLENYKYGLLMEYIPHLKAFEAKDRNNNVLVYDIESKQCEVDEYISNFLNNPTLQLFDGWNSKISGYKNTTLLCQNKVNIQENIKLIRRIYFITLKLKNNTSFKLIANFSDIGLWIWDKNKFTETKLLSVNKGKYCNAIGKKDNILINQKYRQSIIKVYESQIEIPIFKARIISHKLYEFILKNKVDGIIGLNHSSIQSNNVFDYITQNLGIFKRGYIVSLECIKNKMENGQPNHPLLSVYDLNSTEISQFEEENFTRSTNSSVEILVENKVKFQFDVKTSLNLNIFGVIVPEFRVFQLFSLLKKNATQNGYNCEINKTPLGKAIFCDCRFLEGQIEIKLNYEKVLTYSIRLNPEVVNNNINNSTDKSELQANDKSCLIEFYGARGNGFHSIEHWIFGQKICDSGRFNKFTRRGDSAWKIENI